MVCTTPTGSKN